MTPPPLPPPLVLAAAAAPGASAPAAEAAPPELVVHAARLPDAAGDVAFSMVSLDGVALRTGVTLDAALEQSPSFSLFRRTSALGANPTTQGVSLRAIAGSGASRALVTLNGAPQNDPFGGWVIWTALPPIGVADARIVRGAGAGPYGAGALTGVVALDGVEDPRRAGLTASVGGLGFREVEGLAGADVGGVAVIGAGAAEHSDGWIPVHAGRGAADRRLSLESESGAVSARASLADAVLTARLSAYQESRGAGVVGAGSTADGGQAALALARQPTTGRPGWRLAAWTDLSDLVNTTSAIAAGRNAVTPANDQYATPAVGWGAMGAVRWQNAAASLEAGWDVRGASGESRERFSYAAGAFTKGRKSGGEAFVGGLYAEGSHLFGSTIVTGGVRIDEWASLAGERIETVLATQGTSLNQKIPDRSGTVPTGRLGVERPLFGGLSWRAAAYAGFRPATLNELHRPFRVGNNVTEANAALEPERLYGGETGFEARFGGLKASATVFVNQLQNAITNVTIGRGPATFPIAGFVAAGGVLFMRENAGTVNADGLEAEAQGTFARGRVVLEAATAITRSRVDGGAAAPQLTGKRPALTPGATSAFGVRVRPFDRLTADLHARYESARFDDDLNTLRLRAAVTLDAGVEYAAAAGISLFLRADNLLNAGIQSQETADHVYSYGPPRLVRIGVRLSR